MYKLLSAKAGRSQVGRSQAFRSLECDFTGCIIAPPSQFLGTRDIHELMFFLENHVKPFFDKLIPGAHILLRIEKEHILKNVLFFGTLDMPLRAVLANMNQTSFHWLLFQKPGAEKLLKIDPKKTFPYHLPNPERTELEDEIFSDSVCRYAETQNVLRPLVKMICPKPKQAKILVPFHASGEVIAACEALKIDSVGFEYYNYDAEEEQQYSHDVIGVLSKMKLP